MCWGLRWPPQESKTVIWGSADHLLSHNLGLESYADGRVSKSWIENFFGFSRSIGIKIFLIRIQELGNRESNGTENLELENENWIEVDGWIRKLLGFFWIFAIHWDQNFSYKNPGTREPRIEWNRELGTWKWKLDRTGWMEPKNCWNQFYNNLKIWMDPGFWPLGDPPGAGPVGIGSARFDLLTVFEYSILNLLPQKFEI